MALLSLKRLILPTHDKPPEYTSLSDLESSSASSTVTIMSKPILTPRHLSNLTLGLSDGLTVPFALTAGLSTLHSTRLVIIAGLAELIAGALSMGLGGYLGAAGEAAAAGTSQREIAMLVKCDQKGARARVRGALEGCGLSEGLMEEVACRLVEGGEEGVGAFLGRFEGKEKGRAWVAGATIAAGYFVGGMVPLLPYFVVKEVGIAFWWSVGVMAVALFGFGTGKGLIVGMDRAECVKEGVQMLVLGGVAASAAVGCVKVASTFG